MDREVWKFVMVVVVVCATAACAPFQQYRTDYKSVCVSSTVEPPAECDSHALQQLPTGHGNGYLLGFIEFDDQGQLWDREQMRYVLGKLQEEAETKPLVIVVFVHGWQHGAAPGDGNIVTFRQVLAQLSDSEAQVAELTHTPPRAVAGVYLGWRGRSITVPLLDDLTFWDRKNTAQKVGDGGVTEVLSRLELIKRDRDGDVPGGATRLVIVGHSFGGLVVNTAVAQILQDRFVQSTARDPGQHDVAGLGDLVVLINPAFEALQLSSLSDMASERDSYPSGQLPVLLELTSEADWATRYVFPVGRWLSTFFEKEQHDRKRRNGVTGKEETIDESKANVAAVGHFEPYRTHRLYPLSDRDRSQLKAPSPAESVQSFLRSSADWANDTPGSKIPFGDVMLERTATSAARDPYLITYVDGHLINGHNDISDPRIVEFVKQLILISTQSPEQTKAIRELAPTATTP